MIVTATAWGSRVVSGAVSLIVIRLLIGGLGKDGYAVYALIANLLGWYLLTDLGLANALQNAISQRRAQNEDYRPLLSTAVLVAGGLFLGCTVLLAILCYPLGQAYLQEMALQPAARARYFFLGGVLFLATAMGNLGYKTWYAEQRGYLSTGAPAVAALVALISVWTVGRVDPEDRLFWFILAGLGPPAALSVISLLTVVVTRIGSAFTFDRALFLQLWENSRKFWIIAVMAAASLHVDYLVMSLYLNPAQIVKYNVSTRFFELLKVLYSALLLALWPTWTEMVARKEWDAILKYVWRYVALGMGLMSVCAIALVFLMPHVVQLLAPAENIVVPVSFVVLLGVFEVVRTWTNTFAMVLMSMSKLRPLMMIIPLQAACTIGLQVALAPRYGLHGITGGLLGAFLCTSAWMLPVVVLREVRREAGS